MMGGGVATEVIEAVVEDILTDVYAFSIIQPPSGTSPTADSPNDTLNIATANNILSIVGDASTDTLTFTINQGNIDHGSIAGLGDDDHTQYHTNARALTWLNSRSASDLSNGVTGSGKIVLESAPTLVTPVLGVASATSINKVAITAPATSATLTIANGKTLTVSNTLTFTGTDSSSVAFGTGGTVAYTGNKLSVFAATTSAELASVISDEEGTGLLVFNDSPDFTTRIRSPLAGFGATFAPLVPLHARVVQADAESTDDVAIFGGDTTTSARLVVTVTKSATGAARSIQLQCYQGTTATTVRNLHIQGDGGNAIIGNGGSFSDSNFGVNSLTFSGLGVISIRNANTLPTANNANGGYLYVDAGALKWRGSGGTITTLGAA